MNIAQFCVDKEKCIGCGSCTKVCPGGLLSLDEERKAMIKPITEFGWNGCWKCEHCPAVCPAGAISVLGHHPEDDKMKDREDINAFFELLCASRGLGAVIMTFPLDVLKLMPDVMGMLQIPEDHFIPMIIGFGYPQIRYHRGVQKEMAEGRIHRPMVS